MAASACTTLVPVAARRPVAHPAASIALAFAVMRSTDIPNQIGRGCILLDDGPVFFDAGRMPEPGGRAVVVDQDGRLAVEAVYPPSRDGYQPLGAAMVYVVERGPYARGISEIRRSVALVGAVME